MCVCVYVSTVVLWACITKILFIFQQDGVFFARQMERGRLCVYQCECVYVYEQMGMLFCVLLRW